MVSCVARIAAGCRITSTSTPACRKPAAVAASQIGPRSSWAPPISGYIVRHDRFLRFPRLGADDRQRRHGHHLVAAQCRARAASMMELRVFEAIAQPPSKSVISTIRSPQKAHIGVRMLTCF